MPKSGTPRAALMGLSQCRNPKAGEAFPAVITEKYVRHEQLEYIAQNVYQRVPAVHKTVKLRSSLLVVVDGVGWPIATSCELNTHKNGYVPERKGDLQCRVLHRPLK